MSNIRSPNYNSANSTPRPTSGFGTIRTPGTTPAPRPTSASIVRPLQANNNTMQQLPPEVRSPDGQMKAPATHTSVVDDDSIVAEDSNCSYSSERKYSSDFDADSPRRVVAKPVVSPLVEEDILKPSPVPSLELSMGPPRKSLPNMPSDYQVSKKELLGKGTFGCVFRALDRETNRIFVVKEIPIVDRGGQFTNAEIEVLGSLDHRNIIKLMGFRQSDCLLEIFMEYVSGGNITSVIKQFGVLTETQARNYTSQILDGLIYLHDLNVIHRDLKGDNILVEVDGTVKLADFGTARECSTVANTVTGTTAFMAPEIIKGSGYNKEVDIWSLGCCVLEMVSGRPPFSEFANQYAAMFHIANMTSTDNLIPPGLSTDGRDFLRKCLSLDPAGRPCARVLRTHSWFTPKSK